MPVGRNGQTGGSFETERKDIRRRPRLVSGERDRKQRLGGVVGQLNGDVGLCMGQQAGQAGGKFPGADRAGRQEQGKGGSHGV